jgi:hypothetical protein
MPMKPLLTLLFLSFSLNVNAQDRPLTRQEIKVHNLIARLPEVVEFNKDMLRELKRPLIITVDNNPTPTDPYYTIAVAEDFGDRAFTYWRFCVNEKTKAISYFDVVANKKTPLDKWRKSGRKW